MPTSCLPPTRGPARRLLTCVAGALVLVGAIGAAPAAAGDTRLSPVLR